MEYVAEVLNRSTGDLEEVSLGEWITVTELGERYGVGRNRVREVLHHMGLLGPEGKHGRYRLTHDAVCRGLGKRIEAGKGRKYPFDVFSPEAQALIQMQWATALQELEAEKNSTPEMTEAYKSFAEFQASRNSELTTKLQVHWYLEHFPNLTQEKVGKLIGISQAMVSKHARSRDKRKAFLLNQNLDIPADADLGHGEWAQACFGRTPTARPWVVMGAGNVCRSLVCLGGSTRHQLARTQAVVPRST